LKKNNLIIFAFGANSPHILFYWEAYYERKQKVEEKRAYKIQFVIRRKIKKK
jgi:hypothetical protein